MLTNLTKGIQNQRTILLLNEQCPLIKPFFRRIKKNAFQQNYHHSIGRPSTSFVSFRVPPGTFPIGSFSTNSWASKRHAEVDHGHQKRLGGVNSYWKSNSKRQTDLPSTQRQAQPGFTFPVEREHQNLLSLCSFQNYRFQILGRLAQ